jgi:type I site-specific restriction endonuclease
MKVWDPLRKKDVALTPEERVRQWCIGVLRDQMKVPAHLMMSEAGFKLGDKQFRADILVYDRQARPLVVVECKRPEVELTQEVLDQAIRYNMVLDVKYMIITNGTRTYICRKGEMGYSFIDYVPDYEQMLG